ncbi:hypothetical protein [Paenibacillus sp. MER 99-2]|uniref:hypothetical protein n=1 Tax=Paenibacillus sp. MER 99-2 TaxID=2939572 RepID=UPI00203FB2E4|nr:hypothetical protein [Paenibacillus sp. MER 99-2]MCM3174461.1 hypothetical protein [Paenibacillus sp. MER 99-2]
MNKVVQVVGAISECGDRGSEGYEGHLKGSGSVGSGEHGEQEVCLSEAAKVGAKGREDAGHECSFCCTCWTDE